MIDYEIHFFRADGTLSLRLLAAAENNDEVLLAVAKMRSQDFASVKVWRGIARTRVRHRPAIAIPDAMSGAVSDTSPEGAAESHPGMDSNRGPRNFRL